MGARIFEPFAVRKCAFLAGVSEESYLPVAARNPALKKLPMAAFPLGFDPCDQVLLSPVPPIWGAAPPDIRPYVYAGAFLPKARYYVQEMFRSIAELRRKLRWDERIRLFFLGTGKQLPGESVMDYARHFHVSDIVMEHPERISYLSVLSHLRSAAGVLVIGSTESHYTASKIFQTLLCGRPLLAIFHRDSSVNAILEECCAEHYLVRYDPAEEKTSFQKRLRQCVEAFFCMGKTGGRIWNRWNVIRPVNPRPLWQN